MICPNTCETCANAEERREALEGLKAADEFVQRKMPEWTRTCPRTYTVSHEELAALARAVRQCTVESMTHTLIEALHDTSVARAAIVRHAPWLDPWRGVARDLAPEMSEDAAGGTHDFCESGSSGGLGRSTP